MAYNLSITDEQKSRLDALVLSYYPSLTSITDENRLEIFSKALDSLEYQRLLDAMTKTDAPLLTIGIHDYTKSIKVPSYNVNKIDVYNEWTDANGKVHRDNYRTSVEGNFTIWFDDIDRYERFITDLSINVSKTVDGLNLLTVYINNTMELYTGYFYVDFKPVNNLPYYGSKQHDGYDVTIKER